MGALLIAGAETQLGSALLATGLPQLRVASSGTGSLERIAHCEPRSTSERVTSASMSQLGGVVARASRGARGPSLAARLPQIGRCRRSPRAEDEAPFGNIKRDPFTRCFWLATCGPRGLGCKPGSGHRLQAAEGTRVQARKRRSPRWGELRRSPRTENAQSELPERSHG